MYAIRNMHNDQLFWSDRFGWVESPAEDLFTQQERDSLNLPIYGVWVKVLGE